MAVINDDPDRPQAIRDFLSQKPKVNTLGRALKAHVPNPQARRLRGVATREKAFAYLDRVWGSRAAWFPPEFGTSQFGQNFCQAMQSVTKLALQRSLDLHNLWQPGGLLRKRVYSTDPPRFNTEILRLVKEDLRQLPMPDMADASAMAGPSIADTRMADTRMMADTSSLLADTSSLLAGTNSFLADTGSLLTGTTSVPVAKVPVPGQAQHEAPPPLKVPPGPEMVGTGTALLAELSTNQMRHDTPPSPSGLSQCSGGVVHVTDDDPRNTADNGMPHFQEAMISKDVAVHLYDPARPDIIDASIAELEQGQRLGDSTIALVSQLLKRQLAFDSSVIILDPLWLQVDGDVIPSDFPFKSMSPRVLIPLHHLIPEHWTLAYIDVAKRRVQYFDSLWNEARFQQVSRHLLRLLAKRCGPPDFRVEPAVCFTVGLVHAELKTNAVPRKVNSRQTWSAAVSSFSELCEP